MSGTKALCHSVFPRLLSSIKVPFIPTSIRSLRESTQLRSLAPRTCPAVSHSNHFNLGFFRHNSEQNKPSDPYVCWKCGINVDSIFFCEKCHHVLKPNAKQNYFSLFNIPLNFIVETKELTQKYRKILNELHPDRFSSKNHDEKLISEEYSSLINKAYSTLLNPLERGIYLLQLEGLSIEEDSITLDAEMLMSIMEKNEELEDAETEEAFAELKASVQKEIDELLKETNEAYQAKDFSRMKIALSKMKYYESIVLKIKERKQALNIPN